MSAVQVTVAVATLLRLFLDDPTASRYGYELMRATGFASGKLYPILARLEKAGWLVRLEPASDSSGGPPRVGYTLAPDAVATVRAELSEVTGAVSGWNLKPAVKWTAG